MAIPNSTSHSKKFVLRYVRKNPRPKDRWRKIVEKEYYGDKRKKECSLNK
jgi:hypothetical protein